MKLYRHGRPPCDIVSVTLHCITLTFLLTSERDGTWNACKLEYMLCSYTLVYRTRSYTYSISCIAIYGSEAYASARVMAACMFRPPPVGWNME